jgi:hypothetical protein
LLQCVKKAKLSNKLNKALIVNNLSCPLILILILISEYQQRKETL